QSSTIPVEHRNCRVVGRRLAKPITKRGDMSSAQVHERPDTQEMVIIHRVFRREFRIAAELVRATGTGDRERAAHLAGHLTFLLDTLHPHHSGEDDLLWPKLLERSDPDIQLINRMQAQHQDVAEAIHAIEDAMPQWTVTADAASRDRLAEAIERMSAV